MPIRFIIYVIAISWLVVSSDLSYDINTQTTEMVQVAHQEPNVKVIVSRVLSQVAGWLCCVSMAYPQPMPILSYTGFWYP